MSTDSDSDESVKDLASQLSDKSKRKVSYDLETSISRMEGSMDRSPSVEATFTLSQVAEGAEDLCDVISEPDADITQLVDVSKKYLEDMTKFQLGIASRHLLEGQQQNNDEKQFVAKMKKRFAQLDNVLEDLKQMSLEAALPQGAETGLETIGSMVGSESFKFAGQFYPNPSQFLPELFRAFPTLFCSKKEVADVHGDGQASNLMVDSKTNKLVQVDVRKGDKLVSPHAEAAKMVVFGPEFTGCILNGRASVGVDESGLSLLGHWESHLENHQDYKSALLKALDDKGWAKMQAFQQDVSPDFGLNIRLLGAVQAEADIGSFLAKFKESPNDINLKRRAVADKVLALKLQKELFDYINDGNNLPESQELIAERSRLNDYIEDKMNRLNQ